MGIGAAGLALPTAAWAEDKDPSAGLYPANCRLLEAREALRVIEDREVFGKVVVAP